MASILIVDDDPYIRELIRATLSVEGYQLKEAGDGREALTRLEEGVTDLVILDIMMPVMDGWELCREIRSHHKDLPLLMVSAKAEAVHRVKGFQLGADDYVVKPFDPMELGMRVKALLKRYRIASSQQIRLPHVVIDQSTYEVSVQDRKYALPPKEFELLYKLAGAPSRIFTRAQLIEEIWGHDYEGDDRTVDVHIKRIRERFETITDSFRITTVRGLGYRLEVAP